MAKASSPVIAQALAELRAAIAALETVAARRETGEISSDKLKTELTLVQDDRARLANDLDAALARLGRYDQISADLEQRIARAMNAVKEALGDDDVSHEDGEILMGQVAVTIADKIYRIACNDGQEEHLYKLAAELDRKIAEMRAAFGEIGDNRLTVMAAITFMDDREDMKRRVSELETEMIAIREQHRATDTIHSKLESEIAAAISAAATQLNAITSRLNGDEEDEG